MKTILQQIAANKQREIQQLKQRHTLSDFEVMPLFQSPVRSLSAALRHEFSVISEFKRKSPSAGILSRDIDPIEQASKYATAGASAISCLTDKRYFDGTLQDLAAIRETCHLPVLRKDFILDEIQLFEARAFGADVVLLISELLEPEHAKHLTIIAQSLGMEVLMEAHDRQHLEKINDLVDVIGINNRNLHEQRVTLETSLELRSYIPSHRLCISESGIRTHEELRLIEKAGYHGALIGESLMRTSRPESIISGHKKSA